MNQDNCFDNEPVIVKNKHGAMCTSTCFLVFVHMSVNSHAMPCHAMPSLVMWYWLNGM